MFGTHKEIKLNKIGYPLILITGLLAYAFISSAIAFRNGVSFNLNKIFVDYAKTVTSGFKKIYLNINVDVINPTSFFATVKDINLNIVYNNTVIATIRHNREFRIPHKNKVTLTIPTEIDLSSLTSNIRSAVDDILTSGINVTVTGIIITGYGTIKYNEVKSITI